MSVKFRGAFNWTVWLVGFFVDTEWPGQTEVVLMFGPFALSATFERD